ncbi:MAG: HD domain-containing protein [Patescibacteria group bacterium UBA2103]
MTYSLRLENAIRIASQYHDGQRRKEHDRLPYVSHVFSVAALVSNFIDDEDVIIAALLHDTVEDTNMTYEELEDLFGENVRTLVENVSEPKSIFSWKGRKDAYLQRLEEGTQYGLLIAACDKVHNMQSKYRIYQTHGRDFVEKLGLLHEKYLWYHGEVLDILKRKLEDTALIALYEETFKKEKELLQS